MLLDVAAPLVLFSGTHVGLSNVREPITAMAAADGVGLVGLDIASTAAISGRAMLWPTADVAGRQLFRGAYSAVAFATPALRCPRTHRRTPDALLDALTAGNVAALNVPRSLRPSRSHRSRTRAR